MRRSAHILALIAGLATATASAATTVRLNVPDTPLYLGEPFTVQVVVSDFQDCQTPQWPTLAGVQARFLGATEETRMSVINGQATQSHDRSFQYELTVKQAGVIDVPPIPVRVDGTLYQTQPAKLTVRRPTTSDQTRLAWAEVTTPRTRLYVGQRVPLTLQLWVLPARAGEQTLRGQDMARFVSGQRTAWGPLQPLDHVNTREHVEPDGSSVTYYLFESTTPYVPARAGALAFDDVVIGLDYPTRFGRDVFGGLSVTDVRSLTLHPEAPNVTVLDLPTTGRPANLSGAVGTFEITARVNPARARVGDPLELTLEIRGDGDLATLPPPRLADEPALTAGFRVPPEQPAGTVENSRKRFSFVLRAMRPNVTEIPPLEYAYFDPDREAYAVARTPAIPVHIDPAAEVSPGEVASAVPTDSASQPAAVDALLGNETSETTLLSRQAAVTATQAIAATLAPPVLALLTWLLLALRRWRPATPAAQRRAAALRHAQQRLARAATLASAAAASDRDAAVTSDAGEGANSDAGAASTRDARAATASAVAAALRGYIADRLDAPIGRLSGAALAAELRTRGIRPAVVNQFQELLARCDQVAFAGGAGTAPAELVEAGWAALAALRREAL
jgi:hypothetical protein